jgi:hypothetical protein
MQRRHSISNHHGDVNWPNNLAKAKQVAQRWGHEIDIYEVDFVSFRGQIVSAHDYDIAKIGSGSPLEQWVDFVVVEQRKVLWLDVKENLPVYLACGFENFDHEALFDVLKHKREMVAAREGLDIAHYIIIGCQEPVLHAQIAAHSRHLRGYQWRLILDSPSVWSYVLQYITPHCLKPHLREYICNDFRHSAYHNYDAISIDQSFFSSRDEIVAFIKSLSLGPETMIIVNSFPRTYAPIVIDGHYVVMQYDYSV